MLQINATDFGDLTVPEIIAAACITTPRRRAQMLAYLHVVLARLYQTRLEELHVVLTQ